MTVATRHFAPCFAEIIDHAAEEDPRECVGFIVEHFGELSVWKMHNADASETTFFIDPRDQYVALNEIADQGAELVGIYHSHPQGTPRPSRTDLRFAEGWPGVAMLICAEGVVRAYTASGEAL